jgi:hypothetical protein
MKHIHPEDIEAFSEIDLHRLAVRPSRYTFSEPSPEFFRWFEYGAKPRMEPLTRTELDKELEKVGHTGGHDAAIEDKLWDRYKDWKLGALRAPIETLQNIVHNGSTEGSHWESARKAADWCRSGKCPSPADVHEALSDLILHAEAEKQQGEWLHRAVEAQKAVEAAYPAEIEERNTERITEKDARKAAEFAVMVEERRAAAATWTPEEAARQARQNLSSLQQETNSTERFYKINDMNLNANANPHYLEVLKTDAPEVVAEIKTQEKTCIEANTRNAFCIQHLEANHRILCADPRFEKFSDEELVKAAFYRGVCAWEKKSDMSTVDTTLSNRETLWKLPDIQVQGAIPKRTDRIQSSVQSASCQRDDISV